MNRYLTQESSSSRHIQLFAIMTVISGLFYAISTLHITDPIGKIVMFSLSPVLGTTNHLQIQIKNELTIVKEAHLLASKFRATQEQNMSLRSELAQSILINEENKKLREQIGAAEVSQFKLIPAKIVSRDREVTIVYDQNVPVAQGAVVVYKNNFVGTIKNSTFHSSSMILATDPDNKISVDIITKDKSIIKGLAYGQFGTSIKVDQIEQNAKIQKGDIVVLAKTATLPEGVIVGEISEVQKIESELFQKGQVTPFFEFDKIDTVFIIQ